jgi:hypothetical protein
MFALASINPEVMAFVGLVLSVAIVAVLFVFVPAKLDERLRSRDIALSKSYQERAKNAALQRQRFLKETQVKVKTDKAEETTINKNSLGRPRKKKILLPEPEKFLSKKATDDPQIPAELRQPLSDTSKPGDE